MRSTALASAAAITALASASLHHLFVGSFKSNHLFSLAYDDESNSIVTQKALQAHNGHPNLGFNYDKTVLYASERDGWTSYAVSSGEQVDFTATVKLKSRCDGDAFKHGQTTIFVAQKFPFQVYGSGRSPCGAVLGVRVDGSLDAVVQNISFRTTSRVKGMVTDPEGKYLFSADQKGNAIWTHKIDAKTGKLDRGTVTEMPNDKWRPMKPVMHPSGRYMYVLLQKMNAVAVYEVVARTGNLAPQLRYTNVTISLIPNNADPKIYRSTDLLLSKDGNILYGTVRYRKPRDNDSEDKDDAAEEDENEGEEDGDEEESPWSALGSLFGGGRGGSNSRGPTATRSSSQPTSGFTPWGRNGKYSVKRDLNSEKIDDADLPIIYKDTLDEVHYAPHIAHHNKRQAPQAAAAPSPGFLTAILLSDPEGAPRVGVAANGAVRGWPLQMIMQANTPTTGGKSNGVAPSPWNNDFFALTDSEVGMVQVWRLDGLVNLPRDGPKNMISQSNPLGPASPYGAGKSGQRSPQMPPPLANIRANIVAEWRAPADAVGDPNMIKGSSGRDETRPSVVKKATTLSRYAALFKRQNVLPEGEGYATESSNAFAPIPSGRGCCANAVWYD